MSYYVMCALAASYSVTIGNTRNMKFLCFTLTILILCVVYKELNAFGNENRLKLNILNGSDKGLQCEASYLPSEIYPIINARFSTFSQLNFSKCHGINTGDIIYYFIVRTTT